MNLATMYVETFDNLLCGLVGCLWRNCYRAVRNQGIKSVQKWLERLT